MATYVLHCRSNMTQILLVALLVTLLTEHGKPGGYSGAVLRLTVQLFKLIITTVMTGSLRARVRD